MNQKIPNTNYDAVRTESISHDTDCVATGTVLHESVNIFSLYHGWVYNWWSQRHHDHMSQTVVYLAAASISAIVFGVLIYYSIFAAYIDGFGDPEVLNCRNWYWAPGYCGINGIDCMPFSSEWFPIRCTSRCALPDASLFIFGSDNMYRGDSRVCVAATHAGLVSPITGGCLLARFSGSSMGYSDSMQNGIQSHYSPLWFPKSLSFAPLPPGAAHHCTEFSWSILGLGVAWLALVTIVIRPWKHILFSFVLLWSFWFCLLINNQPLDFSPIIAGTATMFLLFVGGYYMYFCGADVVLIETDPDVMSDVRSNQGSATTSFMFNTVVTSSEDPVISELPRQDSVKSEEGCWTSPLRLGLIQFLCFVVPHLLFMMMNWCVASVVLFYCLLKNSLRTSYFAADLDLKASIFTSVRNSTRALLTLLALIIVVVIFLAYMIRLLVRSGQWRVLLRGYTVVAVLFIIVALLFQHTYRFHLHHTFVPLLLWPLTRQPGDRVALVAQGALTGMFVNGIAFWPWAPNFDPVPFDIFLDAPPAPQLLGNLTISIVTTTATGFDTMPLISYTEPNQLQDNNINSTNSTLSMVSLVIQLPPPPPLGLTAPARLNYPIGFSMWLNEIEVYHGIFVPQLWLGQLYCNTTYSIQLMHLYSWGNLGMSSDQLLIDTSTIASGGNVTTNDITNLQRRSPHIYKNNDFPFSRLNRIN